MEIRQLKYYLQVCNDLNLSKAANHLFITQQALSQSMKNMEEELGVVLFTRNNHGIMLTEIGDIVKTDVEKFVSEYDALINKIKYDAKSLKGSLRLAIPPGVIATIVPELLHGFSSTYPEVALAVSELSDLECEEMVKNEKCDLACSVLPVDKEFFDFIPILNYCAYAYINKKNPLSRKSSITFDDMQNENFLIISEQYKWHYTILEKCKSCGFTPKITHTSSQVDLLAKLVEMNLGVTIFIEPVAKALVNDNTVIIPISSIEDFRYEAGFILKSKRRIQKYAVGLMIDYMNKLQLSTSMSM